MHRLAPPALVVAVALSLVARAAVAEPSARAREEAQLDGLLAEAQREARIWHYSWIGAYAGISATRAAIAATVSNQDARVQNAVGVAPAAIGNAFALAMPLETIHAVERRQEIDAFHPDDVAARIGAKRRLVEALAEDERRVTGWVPRIVGGVLNLAAAGVMWGATGEVAPAVIQLGVGLSANELKLQTGPRTMRAYVEGGRAATRTPRVAVGAASAQWGLTVRF